MVCGGAPATITTPTPDESVQRQHRLVAAEVPGQRGRQVGMDQMFLPGGHDALVWFTVGGVPDHGAPVGVEDEGPPTRSQDPA